MSVSFFGVGAFRAVGNIICGGVAETDAKPAAREVAPIGLVIIPGVTDGRRNSKGFEVWLSEPNFRPKVPEVRSPSGCVSDMIDSDSESRLWSRSWSCFGRVTSRASISTYRLPIVRWRRFPGVSMVWVRSWLWSVSYRFFLVSGTVGSLPSLRCYSSHFFRPKILGSSSQVWKPSLAVSGSPCVLST